MNQKLLAFLAGLAALGTALGALDLTGFTSIFPEGWGKWFAILPPLGATIVHFALAWGDYMDDGKRNDSFKCAPLVWISALILALACSGCQGVPLSISLEDARSGLSGTYSSKSGLGLTYTAPARGRVIRAK